MPGVSVKEVFLALANADYNRIKWMPDLLWVDLVQKILAGLLMIFLHFGALTRMLVFWILSDEKKLMQRELDAVYRLQNVKYGWEFLMQLLVVVSVLTYAVISSIILPFGLLYLWAH